MSDDEYIGENSDTDFAASIQEQVENTIRDGLNSPDMAVRMKAASLAEKMGLLKVKDRNVKITETAQSVVDHLLHVSIENGWSIPQLVQRMTHHCIFCQHMRNEAVPIPRVIE